MNGRDFFCVDHENGAFDIISLTDVSAVLRSKNDEESRPHYVRFILKSGEIVNMPLTTSQWNMLTGYFGIKNG